MDSGRVVEVKNDPSATVVNPDRVRKYKKLGLEKKENIDWNTRLAAIDKARKEFFQDQVPAKVNAWERAVSESFQTAGTDSQRETYLNNHIKYIEKMRLLVTTRTGTPEVTRYSSIGLADTMKYLMDNLDGIDEKRFFPGQRMKTQLALNEGVHPTETLFYSDLVHECNALTQKNKPSVFTSCLAFFSCCKPKRTPDALLDNDELRSGPTL